MPQIATNYDRQTATAIAVLKQRANSLYGLPIDRFARSCGIRLNKRYKPSNRRGSIWSKDLKTFIDALSWGGVIVVQKTFPLIVSEPYRVYLAGTEPPLQLLRQYKNKASHKRKAVSDRALTPITEALATVVLQPKQQQVKNFLTQQVEPDGEWHSLDVFDYWLDQHNPGFVLHREGLNNVCRHLAAIGFFQRQAIGNKVAYRRTLPTEKQFAVGQQVVRLPGTASESFGVVQAVQSHPLYPSVVQLTVLWADGTQSLASNEITYICTALNSQGVAA